MKKVLEGPVGGDKEFDPLDGPVAGEEDRDLYGWPRGGEQEVKFDKID